MDFGITRVANVTGLDNLEIATALAFRPNARSLSVTQGKGIDADSAKASAVMEAIEHFHAEYADPRLHLGSARDMSKRHRLVDVERLARRARPFDPRVPLLWAEAFHLITGEAWLVPYEVVHLNLTLPLPPGSGICALGSNGLASGNTISEAVAHGLWELVERDAMALFFQMSAEEQYDRRLDLSTIDAPGPRQLIAQCEAADVQIALWDVSSDVGVATVYCALVEAVYDPFRPVGKACGSGCHADCAVAVCRAITEAAQSRLTRITGSRDDIRPEDAARLRSETAILRAQKELAAPSRSPRHYGEIASASAATFEEDLAWTTRKLAEVGMADVLVVDLSREPLPVSVVRVIVPGLEGASDAPDVLPGRRAAVVASRAP
jgi:ribosomal protein S12 methylthiotransferase accessory factor